MRRRVKGKIRKKRKLSVREHRIVSGVLSGKSVSRAMVEAGANPSSKSYQERMRPGGDMWAAAVEALNAQGATLGHAAKRVKECLNAKETKFFAHEGKVKDKRDVVAHGVRLDAADTVYRVNRIYPVPKDVPDVPTEGPVVSIQFLVVQSGIQRGAADNGKDVEGIQFRIAGSKKGGTR